MTKPWQNPLWGELQHELTARMSGPLELSHDKQAFQLTQAIWPKVEEMLAKILEYEHALEHVADKPTHEKYAPVFCESCMSLAQSALDGVNREDFVEIARGD